MPSKAPTRRLNEIEFATIHHSSTYPGASNKNEAKKRAKSYDNFHSSKSYALETKGEYGFRWVSYHYLIAKDGSVLTLQHLKYVRNHATDNYLGSKSHNKYGIAILLDGNFDVEKPTDKQLESAAQLIAKFNRQYGKNLEIRGHKEQAINTSPTNCPGRYMGTSRSATSKLKWIINRVSQLSGNASGGGNANIGGLLIAVILALIYWLFKPKEEVIEVDEPINGDSPVIIDNP